MPKLNWDGNDFRNSRDSSGTVSDNISRDGDLQQGYKHGSLTKGLVAYYPMEKGQGEVLHDGAFDNLGQINGASWSDNGNVGSNSLSFEGNDYAYFDYQFPFENTSWTVSLWVKLSFESARQTILNWGDGDFDHWWNIFVDDELSNDGEYNDFHARFDDSNTRSDIDISNGFTYGEWTQITVVHREGDRYELYANGDMIGYTEDYGSVSENGNNTLYLGQGANGSYRMNGKIEDFRVYNRALSEPEVKALDNAGNGVQSGVVKNEKSVPGQNEGGISRYKFNGTADDDWGSNNGTFYGDTPKYSTGAYQQAGDFNGTNNYIDIGSPSELDFTASDDFAISCWINSEDLSSDRHHIISTRSSSNNWLFIGTYTDGSLEFRCAGDSNANAVSRQIDTGKWHHILGVYKSNDNSVKLYMNGSLVGEDSSSTISGSFLGGDDWEIGRRQNSSYRRWYNGKIDDVRIYNKALTPLQVEKLYHKGAYRISRESTLQ